MKIMLLLVCFIALACSSKESRLAPTERDPIETRLFIKVCLLS